MGNLLNTLKGFLANKNTVTILGVLAGVVVLYLGYNYRINQSIATIQVYYVTEAVGSNTQLSEENLKLVTINASLNKTYKNLVTNLNQVKDSNGEFFYVNFDHSLTAGSLLCTDDLVAKADKADEKLYKNLQKGERIHEIAVTIDSTQGNSISPGNSIDIYLSGTDESGKVIYAPFIENIKVVDVVDTQWTTTAGSDTKTPKYIIIAVSEEIHRLLRIAPIIPGYNFKIVPVADEASWDEIEGDKNKIVSDYLKNIIEANSAYTGS